VVSLNGVANGDKSNGEKMNIEEAVSNAAAIPEGSTLVAKPPLSWGSEAMFIQLTEDYQVPQPIQEAGFQYLLSRDDLLDLLVFLRKKKVSSRTAAEFVIHYAMTDSTPAWIHDIPDV